MAGPDFAAALADLDQALSSIEAVVDPERKRAEIAELEPAVAAPDLWDDPDNAQRVTSRLSALQSEVDRVVSLRSRLDDLAVLVELGQEEGDAASLAEAETELAPCSRRSRPSRSAPCCRGSTTSARPWSPSAPRPAASTRRTSPPCCCGCTCAGPSGTTTPPRSTTPPTPRRRGSSRRPSRSRRRSRTARCRSSRAPTGWSGSPRSTTRAAGRPPSPGSRCCR